MSASTACGHAVALAYRRNVPFADQVHCSKNNDLFDHFIGTREQRCGHIQTERLGGLEVDRQFVFG